MKPKDRQREIVERVACRGQARIDGLSDALNGPAETMIDRTLTQRAVDGARQNMHRAARRHFAYHAGFGDPDAAQIARVLGRHARRCRVLAHTPELGKTGPHRFSALRDMDVLDCDTLPGSAFMAAADSAGGHGVLGMRQEGGV